MQGEVGPGYKQTEVGVIPDDWEVSHLGSLVSETAPIRYGVVQIGPDVSGGVPIVPIKYLKSIATSILHRSACEIEGRFAGSRVRGSDVLISVKGTIGRVGIVPSGFEGNIAREIARVRLRSGIEPLFVAFQLESGHTQQRINEAVVGTTRLEFSIAAVRQFKIALPSSQAEQRAIAAALADADSLVAALEEMIAKKRELKQAAMQHLLTGKTRLPGFSGDWEVKRLGEVAGISKGAQLHRSRITASGMFPHYNGGVSPSGYTDQANCAAGTVAISEGGNSCGFVNYISSPFWCGGHCYALSPHRDDKLFLFQYLKLRQTDIMGLRVGSGLPNVQKTALANLLVTLPTNVTEQTAIAEILSDMDADLAALEAQAAKARAVKQGMMQELLTGRVRLV